MIVVLLAVASTLCAARIFLVILKQIKQPFYKDFNLEAMSPMEVADKQKKIFK